MNLRNLFAELTRRNVSESRAHELAGRTEQSTADRLGVNNCGYWVADGELICRPSL
jgi:hypothetical protein